MKKLIDTSKPWELDGYTIESHLDLGKIDLSKISLYLSEEQKKQKNGYIAGSDLIKELEDKQPLNSAVLKYLLDNPKLIPEEWKEKHVFFWGTIYCSPNGNRNVLCLCWCGGEWRWDYYWLAFVWDSSRPSAVLASPLKLGNKPLDILHLEIKNIYDRRQKAHNELLACDMELDKIIKRLSK